MAVAPLLLVRPRSGPTVLATAAPRDLNPFTGLKLLRHSDRIAAMLRGELVYPVAAEIDLSNVCPHDCPFCSFGTNATGGYRQDHWDVFPGSRMLTLLDELAAVGVKAVTFTGGGEPLVHKDAAAIFEKAAGLLEFGLVTNGWLLRGRVADVLARSATFVRVSLDAGTPITHAATHGLPPGQFQYDRILAQLRDLRLQADTFVRAAPLVLGASFCVMDANYKEIYAAAKAVKDLGGDYLEVRPTYPTTWRSDGCTWTPTLTPEHWPDVQAELDHARGHLESDTFRIVGLTDRFANVFATRPIKAYTQCRTGPLTTVIGADGHVWHCCVQRGEAFFQQGSVIDRSFADVWADVHARQMHTAIDLTQCPRCRYDSLNAVIEHAYLRDGLHANFI